MKIADMVNENTYKIAKEHHESICMPGTNLSLDIDYGMIYTPKIVENVHEFRKKIL